MWVYAGKSWCSIRGTFWLVHGGPGESRVTRMSSAYQAATIGGTAQKPWAQHLRPCRPFGQSLQHVAVLRDNHGMAQQHVLRSSCMWSVFLAGAVKFCTQWSACTCDARPLWHDTHGMAQQQVVKSSCMWSLHASRALESFACSCLSAHERLGDRRIKPQSGLIQSGTCRRELLK